MHLRNRVNSDNFTVVNAGCFREHRRKTAELTKKMSPGLYQFQVPFYIFLRFLTVPNHSYKKPQACTSEIAHAWI